MSSRDSFVHGNEPFMRSWSYINFANASIASMRSCSVISIPFWIPPAIAQFTTNCGGVAWCAQFDIAALPFDPIAINEHIGLRNSNFLQEMPTCSKHTVLQQHLGLFYSLIGSLKNKLVMDRQYDVNI